MLDPDHELIGAPPRARPTSPFLAVHWMGFIDELRVLPPADFSQLTKLNEAYSPRMAPNPGHVQPAANLQITLDRAKNRGKYASTAEMVEAFQQEWERSRMQAE